MLATSANKFSQSYEKYNLGTFSTHDITDANIQLVGNQYHEHVPKKQHIFSFLLFCKKKHYWPEISENSYLKYCLLHNGLKSVRIS